MAKTVKEQIEALNEKISKLEEQKKSIEAKIAEAKGKKSVLESKVDLGYLESIKALGLSMEDIMNLAREKAKTTIIDIESEEEIDLKTEEEIEKEEVGLYKNNNLL